MYQVKYTKESCIHLTTVLCRNVVRAYWCFHFICYHLYFLTVCYANNFQFSLNFREFQFAQAMLFAIEEINNSTGLLPGISLGYNIYDTCGSIARSVKVALALTNGIDNVSSTSEAPCTRPAQVQAIMGETSSSPSTAIATVIGPFHIPLVSMTAKHLTSLMISIDCLNMCIRFHLSCILYRFILIFF